jgi:uncharacterized protein YndB with AHSA1/START domain
VWQLWADPRQLERWWGPPQWPATFYRHDFVVGGRCAYYMTGPDGSRSHGGGRFADLQAPRWLAFADGFADDNGEPTGDYGVTRATVAIEPADAGTRMTLVSRFESAEQLEQMLELGMEEGMRLALGQIDAILAG